MNTLLTREELAAQCEAWRAQNVKIVFTNGCYDVLHSGHVELLQAARAMGDILIVAINSDASVRRLKGPTRPVNGEEARAFVLAALGCVDAVCVFEEDTPVETIAVLRPDIHVKGGDYRPDDLPEAATVRAHGGEIRIVPLREGYSTTNTLKKLSALQHGQNFRAVIIIPARWASTRFPGKPLAELGGKTVIERVVEAALQTSAEKPVWVATDDDRIAETIERSFLPHDARVARTDASCATGTDRLAQSLRDVFPQKNENEHRVVVNLQGDEPFVQARHVDALIELMRADRELPMATLATPMPTSQEADPNVVKAVRAHNGDALYFSRAAIPLRRDASDAPQPLLRHIGIYAYTADWLKKMAQLPSSPLEETEKLEQLRALENGQKIRLAVVEGVVNIAIDTPDDLRAAQHYLGTVEIDRTSE
ncbi:MAG TPA: D-glycero-beta-D-manno-heptose 1-phosphate adenylyltransferase [Abditibacteriaceae bacterium]